MIKILITDKLAQELKMAILFFALINFFVCFADTNPIRSGSGIEISFVCEKPDSNCQEMTMKDTNEKFWIEKQLQFSTHDIKVAMRPLALEVECWGPLKNCASLEKSILIELIPEAKARLAQIASQKINMGRRLGIVIDGELVDARAIAYPDLIRVDWIRDDAKANELVSRINKVVKSQSRKTTEK